VTAAASIERQDCWVVTGAVAALVEDEEDDVALVAFVVVVDVFAAVVVCAVDATSVAELAWPSDPVAAMVPKDRANVASAAAVMRRRRRVTRRARARSRCCAAGGMGLGEFVVVMTSS
jgi:RecA/RadA recombinase